MKPTKTILFKVTVTFASVYKEGNGDVSNCRIICLIIFLSDEYITLTRSLLIHVTYIVRVCIGQSIYNVPIW